VAQTARILIADDDEFIRQMLVVALSDAGYSTGEAESVDAVRSALDSEQWDLVLLDTLGTRGQERVSVLADLCKRAGASPVVVLTGWSEVARWAEENGSVAGVLLKPLDLQALLDCVAATLPMSAGSGPRAVQN